MVEPRLSESDYRFMMLIWENEPVPSRELVRLCAESFNWKKSTTYTVLKKLCERGFAQNEGSVVTSLIPKGCVQSYESEKLVERAFGGSLPAFVAAFTARNKLTEREIDELRRLIDENRG